MENKARFITLTNNNMKYTYNTSKTSCRVQPIKIGRKATKGEK